MTHLLKQSTAEVVMIGPFLDASDGVSEETALSPAVEISKDGGAFAAKNEGTTPSHSAEGWYTCNLDSTDTGTLGRLVLKSHDSGTHLPVWHEFAVVPANVYDSLIAGSDTLQAHATEIDNNLITAAAVATGAIDADALATDAANEIRDAILDDATRFSGADIAAILTDTAEIGAAGAGLTEAGGTGDQLTAIPWNAAWDAEVQSEVNDALVALGLDHLLSAAVTGTDVTDNSIIAYLVSSGATADWDTFVNTTDALQAIRDHIGDGTNLTEAGGDGDHLTEAGGTGDHLTEAGGTGDHLTALPLNDLSAAEVNAEVDSAFTTQMADSVSTDGTIATREQALYMILQLLTEFAINSTTMTVKKVDGTTALMTLTLDDDTNPTSLTRAT